MRNTTSTLSHLTAGFTAVLVGYTSSVVIVMQAATAAGASAADIESWLLTLGLLMGVTSIGYSWYYKTPILTAWSTPGAALLVTAATQYNLPTVLGAFVISGLLIFITGLIKPLAEALQRIPAPLATAMLGAILLPICVQAFTPMTTMPGLFVLMFVSYLVAKKFLPKYAMLILLFVGLVSAYLIAPASTSMPDLALAKPVWVTPEFQLEAIVNIALPLYLVTMLSQNLPGITMLRSYHYEVPVKPVLLGTGLSNALLAPLGGFSVNLAAITAAICMNEEADKDQQQRYRAALWAGGFYILAGLLATSVVALFLSFPQEITQMLAGFALLGTLLMCLQTSFQSKGYLEPALITFLVTLSGVSLFGISSPLWGLLIGGLYLRFLRTVA